jgi:proliferating cell nuclear antigen
MRLKIENKSKQEVFVALFQVLKNWNGHINMHFDKDRLYIQSMDKSHVCLANISIKSNWFSEYECNKNNTLAVDSGHFAILMTYSLKHDIIEFCFSDEKDIDNLYINFLNQKDKIKEASKTKTKGSGSGTTGSGTTGSGSFEHFFQLSLIDIEETSLGIPQVEYDVDFTIENKKFIEVLSELNTFGSDVTISCNESVLELNAEGDSAKLKVKIPTDDLDEYAIAEGEELALSFSLNHICKMCTSLKLGQLINVSLSPNYPMALRYNLGDDSEVAFYVAPKVSD